MPSELHEALVEMFREKPQLVLVLLGLVGLARAAGVASTVAAAFPGTVPEYRPDSVVEVRAVGGPLLRVIVVEVQLGRDEGKAFSLPVYQTLARARHRVPCDVVVVTPRPDVATWLRRPIHLGSGSAFQATVIGPAELSRMHGTGIPEIALLCGFASREGDDAVVEEALQTFGELPESVATLYSDLLIDALPAGLKAIAEAWMQQRYEYKTPIIRKIVQEGWDKGHEEGREQGHEDGRLDGLRRGIRAVLEARAIALLPDDEAKLASCVAETTLLAWLRRAAVMNSAADVFTD